MENNRLCNLMEKGIPWLAIGVSVSTLLLILNAIFNFMDIFTPVKLMCFFWSTFSNRHHGIM